MCEAFQDMENRHGVLVYSGDFFTRCISISKGKEGTDGYWKRELGASYAYTAHRQRCASKN